MGAATTLVGGAMVASRILGFLRNSILAYDFGQTRVMDAYNTAYNIPDTLYLVLVGGGISSAFIPVLARYLEKEEHAELRQVVSAAFTTVLVAISAVILLGVVFAPVYMHLLARGFNRPALDLTVMLTRILVVTIIFHALNGVLIGTQYAHSSFLATAIGPLVYNSTIIVLGLLLAHRMGVAAFAWSTLIGAGGNFLVQLWGVRRLGIRLRFRWDLNNPGLRRIGRLMLPVTLGMSVAQVNLLINQSYFASFLARGDINALNLSSRIMLMPVLAATSIGITLLPALSRLALGTDRKAFVASLARSLGAVLFVSIPAGIGLMTLAVPLIRLLFQHGAFTDHATLHTAQALVFYAIGIAAYGAYEILSRAFYALQETRVPLVTGLISMAVGLVLNVILVRVMSYRGLALSYSITGVINAALLLVILRRELGPLGGQRVLSSALRTLVAAGGMGAAVLAYLRLVPAPVWGPRIVAEAIQALLPSGLAVIVFAVLCWILKIPEFNLVLSRIVGRLRHTALGT